MNTTDKKSAWARYYENHKKVWYDSTISMYEKCIVRLVELHRSDEQGWSLSIRKIAGLLGVSANTVMREVRQAISHGLIEASTMTPRKRRKLRLSVSLRAPDTHEITKNQLTHAFIQSVPIGIAEPVSPQGTVNIKSNIKKIDYGSEKERKPFKGKGFENFRKVASRFRPSSR